MDKQRPLFEKGGKLESLYYAFEAGETFLFSPNHTTGIKGAQVKDAHRFEANDDHRCGGHDSSFTLWYLQYGTSALISHWWYCWSLG